MLSCPSTLSGSGCAAASRLLASSSDTRRTDFIPISHRAAQKIHVVHWLQIAEEPPQVGPDGLHGRGSPDVGRMDCKASVLRRPSRLDMSIPRRGLRFSPRERSEANEPTCPNDIAVNDSRKPFVEAEPGPLHG